MAGVSKDVQKVERLVCIQCDTLPTFATERGLIRHYEEVHQKIYFKKTQQKCSTCKNYFRSVAEKMGHRCGYRVGKEPLSPPSIEEQAAIEEEAGHFDEDPDQAEE